MNTDHSWLRSLCGMLVGVAAVAADVRGDHFFCAGTDNTWNDGSNWKSASDCSGANAGVPTAADKVTILSGKTCNVNVTTAVGDHILVESSATLNIEAGKILTLDGDGNAGVSTITGTLYLQGSNSVLAFEDNNQTIDGTGKIVGQHDWGQITVSAGVTLSNETTIEGILRIVPPDMEDVPTFRNEGTVHANASGILHVHTFVVDDSAGADRWKVSASGACLRFTVLDTTQAPTFDGDFVVEGGTLDVDNLGFATHGVLTMTGGTIDVASTAQARFSVPVP